MIYSAETGTEMEAVEIVDLTSDDEGEKVGSEAVMSVKQEYEEVVAKYQSCQSHSNKQVSEENISSGVLSTHSYSDVLEQSLLPDDDTGLSLSPPPICRNFWKAGNYDHEFGSEVNVPNAGNYLHVHPLFLHSNATSHKWAFGAIAELLDNAVDEIQNGATFVIVDKVLNPKDGSPALLIQDDGGGMDPEAMRHCMSFGFSDKKSKITIGQYGNGFKTGSMRLGADVIVFSHRLNNMILTQSIGLLSYTFLMRTQLDRIVVPMVSYKYDTSIGDMEILNDKGQFTSNLSILLQWSPYLSEAELLEQCNDIGSHGTKIVIFNLWLDNNGNLELDFDADPEDIHIHASNEVNEQHITNRFHYSLHAYVSILYLRIPESFRIILRGQVVKQHNIADDLKHVQYILYRPHGGGSKEVFVVTTIGFLKEAPKVNIHGFNIYHKNRLILPFWQVVNSSNSKGRGVVGILQADFIEPTHNKQDFERTSLFQKLEVRLKEMTLEYWDCHCQLIGYQKSMPRAPAACGNKRKAHGSIDPYQMQGQTTKENVTVVGCNEDAQTIAFSADQVVDQEAMIVLEVNKTLYEKCLEFEKAEEDLNLKVLQLRSKIQEAWLEYNALLVEAAMYNL